MPADDLNDLIRWLNANPNKASLGVSAPVPHVVAGLFQKESRTYFTLVPYRNNAVPDLLAGQIDLLVDSLVQLPLVRAGNIKAFALTGETRSARAPDIPTFAELGLSTVIYLGWGGFFAPKGTPKDIISKLNGAAVEALADPSVRSRLIDLGMEIFPRGQQTPEALGALVKADAEKWWPIIKELGIKP
jgi:tripartite-type tricarboxylate transporter receptor subunit TctC